MHRVPTGMGPGATVLDQQTGDVYVANSGPMASGPHGSSQPAQAGTVSEIDPGRGTLVRTIRVGLNPIAMDIDAQRRHLVVLSQGLPIHP